MDLSYYGDTGSFDHRAVLTYGHDPYSDVGWFGSSLIKKIGSAVKQIAKNVKYVAHAVSPLVDKAMPFVQTALKNMGPLGMAASGALGTMKAALDGKSLKEIGLAAAIGAAPSGIDRALQAAVRIGKGDNLLKIGLDEMQRNFKPGSEALTGFEIAKKLLSKSETTKEALGTARRQLISESQRRAFDTAVGHAAVLLDKTGAPRVSSKLQSAVKRSNIIAGNRAPRPIDVLPPPMHRNPVSVLQPSVKLALQAIARNGGNVTAAANHYGAPAAAVRRAMNTKLGPRFGWRSLSGPAASMVLRHMPHTPRSALVVTRGRDTGALTDGGTIYVVENGDFPARIAKKLTGKDTNWPQLIAANPQKKTKSTNIGKVFVSLFAGERLNVPKTWIVASAPAIVPGVPASPAAPSIAVPTSLPPAVDANNENLAGVIQAKALLATWNKTDGSQEAGPTDYGTRPEDMSTTFGPRDRLVALAFERWDNRVRGTKLQTDGEMSAELGAALRNWVETRVTVPVPLPVQLPTVPPIVASSTPAAPSSSAPAPSLPFPALPAASPTPSAPSGTPASPFPAPAAASTPAAAAGGKGGGSDLFLPAAGAVAGGMIFGPIGAIVGAGAALLANQSQQRPAA